jgi:alpha-1,2-mannosyltransferase
MISFVEYFALLALLFGTGALLRRKQVPWTIALAACALPAAAMVVFLWRQCDPQLLFGDFLKAFNPATKVIASLGHDPNRAPVFVNIPIVALVFAPMRASSTVLVSWIAAGIGLISVITAAFLLGRIGKFGPWEYLILAGLMVSCGPLMNSFREGNSTHLLFLVMTGVLVLHQAGRNSAAAVLAASCAWIKLPLFLTGVFFLIQRRRMAFAVFCATAIAILLASILLFGWHMNAQWFHKVVRPSIFMPLGAYNVQSVNGVLARLVFGREYLWNWEPIHVGMAFKVVSGLTVLVILATTVWGLAPARQARSQASRQRELCLLIVTAMLVTSLSWTHYYLFMLMPAALMLGETWRDATDKTTAGIFWCGMLLCLTPLHFIDYPHSRLGGLEARVFPSLTFFGGALIWIALLRLRNAFPDTENPDSPDSPQ